MFEQLSARIFEGDLAPGEALPPERELCQVLGVNRGAIREALKRLAQAGLVDVRHGGKSKVLDYRRNGGLGLLPYLLFSAGDRLDFGVARSVMEMRAALAPDLARLCAQRANPEARAELRRLVRALADCGEDVDARQLVALELWDVIAAGSGNIAYQLAFNTLRETYLHVRELLAQALADEMKADADFEALVAAIEASDASAARDAAARVVDRGTSRVLALLEMVRGLQSPPISPKES